MKTKKIVFTALLSALICVLAPLSFQIGPIPISLATLAIYFVASAAELKISIPAVLVYIFLGAVGVWHAFWIAEALTAVLAVLIFGHTLKQAE